MSFIGDYIGFVRRTVYEDIPQKVIDINKSCFIDTLGVMCYATKSPYVTPIPKYVQSRYSEPQATALGLKNKVSVPDAALVNGFLGHLDDYDQSSPWHVSVLVVPVVLALGEHLRIPGREVLRAACLATELQLKLADVGRNEMAQAGWQQCPVVGTIDAAAIASILMGLDDAAFTNAMGISVSRAGGVIANFGTGTKPYHIGMSAVNGIESALLAACGLTANPEAFEANHGFFSVFCGKQVSPSEFCWNEWETLNKAMMFKKYPCCLSSLSAIETFAAMMTQYRLCAQDVESIRIGLSPRAFNDMIYAVPQNALEAKFSVSFPIGRLLLSGSLRAADFCDAEVVKPEIQALMPKISAYVPEKWLGQYTHANRPCEIRVALKSGNVLHATGEVDNPPLRERMPITDEELCAKFRDCTEGVLSPEKADTLLAFIRGLEDLPDSSVIMELFRQ